MIFCARSHFVCSKSLSMVNGHRSRIQDSATRSHRPLRLFSRFKRLINQPFTRSSPGMMLPARDFCNFSSSLYWRIIDIGPLFARFSGFDRHCRSIVQLLMDYFSCRKNFATFSRLMFSILCDFNKSSLLLVPILYGFVSEA